MKLNEAIRLADPACLALTGSGGKSTALFQLARYLSSEAGTSKALSTKKPVILTATTHMHTDQIKMADAHLILKNPSDLDQLEKNLHGVMLVTGPIDADRTTGVNSDLINRLHAFCTARRLPLLVEADGSRQHPLKAPAEHEPPIPPFVESVVVVAGLSGLGQPLSENFVHRPEIFARLSGLALGETVTSQALVRVLTHSAGGLKNIPTQAHRVVLLNQADTPDLQSIGGKMAQALLESYDAVHVGMLEHSSVQTFERVAGIILAAGEARRFGRPKQLLDFHGQPFVRAVANTALASGLSPVVIVSGAFSEDVEAAVSDLPVVLTHNPDWKNGQSTSIQTGLQALSSSSPSTNLGAQDSSQKLVEYDVSRAGVGAAIFLLVDQPQVTSPVLHALVEQHTQGLADIIAPMVAGQRANPVLFDRRVFPDLMALSGDVGGRKVFGKYQVTYLPWHDESLLLDVDTPEDLEKLRKRDI
jgi:molybdenum cofactor cytidylyltransferase